MSSLKKKTFLLIFLSFVLIFLSFSVVPCQGYSIKSNYKRIARELEHIRGLNFKRNVPYSMKSKTYLRNKLISTLKQELPPKKLKAVNATLKTFGFISKNFNIFDFLINLYTEQIAGMYDPKTHSMMLLKGQSSALDNPSQMQQFKALGINLEMKDLFLMHEMEHAIQDQYFNLNALIKKTESKKNDDRTFAMQSLIEGDATVIMFYYMFDKVGKIFGGTGLSGMVDMSQLRDQMIDSPMGAGQKQFANAPLYFKRIMVFPYIEGMMFVDYLKKRGGWRLVNKAFRRLPLSTEQILHPHKYLNWDPPIYIVFKKLSKKAGGYYTIEENVVGEMVMRILFEKFLPSSNFKSIAKGWGGDKFRIYSRGRDNFLVWYTTWDSKKDAKEFFYNYIVLLKKKYPGLRWVKSIPKRAYLGERDNRYFYSGISGKNVVALELCPKTLTGYVLRRIWKVNKIPLK